MFVAIVCSFNGLLSLFHESIPIKFIFYSHKIYSQYKQLMLAVSLKQDFALTTDDGKKRKQGIFKKELKTLSKSS